MQNRATPEATNSSELPPIFVEFILAIIAKDNTNALAALEALVSQQISLELTTQGRTPLILSVQQGLLDVTTRLLEHGANIEGPSEHTSPLDIAAQKGSLELVKLLISKGADVKRKFGTDRTTVLHQAVAKGHKEIVAELVNVMPTELIDAKTTKGLTALHFAAKSLDVIKVLIGSNENITANTIEANILTTLALLIGVSREDLRALAKELTNIKKEKHTQSQLSTNASLLILKTINQNKILIPAVATHTSIINLLKLSEACLNWKNAQFKNISELASTIDAFKVLFEQSKKDTVENLHPSGKMLASIISSCSLITIVELVANLEKSTEKLTTDLSVEDAKNLLKTIASCEQILQNTLHLLSIIKLINVNQATALSAKISIRNLISKANEKILFKTSTTIKSPKSPKSPRRKIKIISSSILSKSSDSDTSDIGENPPSASSAATQTNTPTIELNEPEKTKPTDATTHKQEASDNTKTLFEEITLLKEKLLNQDQKMAALKQKHRTDKSLIDQLKKTNDEQGKTISILRSHDRSNKAVIKSLNDTLAEKTTENEISQEILRERMRDSTKIIQALREELTILKASIATLDDENEKLKGELLLERRRSEKKTDSTTQAQSLSTSTSTLFANTTLVSENPTDKMNEIKQKAASTNEIEVLESCNIDVEALLKTIKTGSSLHMEACLLHARLQFQLMKLERKYETRRIHINKALQSYTSALLYAANHHNTKDLIAILTETHIMHGWALKHQCYAITMKESLGRLKLSFSINKHDADVLSSLSLQLKRMLEGEYSALDFNILELQRINLNVDYHLLLLTQNDNTKKTLTSKIISTYKACIITICQTRKKCRPEDIWQLDAQLSQIYKELTDINSPASKLINFDDEQQQAQSATPQLK